MANDLLPGFLLRAGDYTDRLLVIRCFPSPDEIDEIDPDRIVICRKQHVKRYCDLRHKLKSLDEIRKYAAARGIPVLELD